MDKVSIESLYRSLPSEVNSQVPDHLASRMVRSEEGLQQTQGVESKSFGDVLQESVDKVNLYQTQADTAIKELVAGRSKNIHETMLSIERADSSLKLMMQVRNKILDAYKEIMRMQV
jgi:flagellar hook-basal body complex protein FliE